MAELERQFNDPTDWYINSQWTYLMRELRLAIQTKMRGEDIYGARLAQAQREIDRHVDHVKLKRAEKQLNCQAETSAGYYDDLRGFANYYSIGFMKMPEPGTDMNNFEVQEYWSKPRFDEKTWAEFVNRHQNEYVGTP